MARCDTRRSQDTVRSELAAPEFGRVDKRSVDVPEHGGGLRRDAQVDWTGALVGRRRGHQWQRLAEQLRRARYDHRRLVGLTSAPPAISARECPFRRGPSRGRGERLSQVNFARRGAGRSSRARSLVYGMVWLLRWVKSKNMVWVSDERSSRIEFGGNDSSAPPRSDRSRERRWPMIRAGAGGTSKRAPQPSAVQPGGARSKR